MKNTSEDERRRRLELIARVNAGYLTFTKAANIIGIDIPALYAWAKRNKADIVVIPPSPKAIKCDYCDEYFVTRKSLIGHIGKHPGGRALTCRQCGNKLTTLELERKTTRKNPICYPCAKVYREAYYKRPDKELWRHRYRRQRRRRAREIVFSAYGKFCACCGEDQVEFLCIDHVDGGGAAHVREVGDVYQWLIKNDFPEGFQILCYNCNMAKAFYDECPHLWHTRYLEKET